jgi:hypothetical protein
LQTAYRPNDWSVASEGCVEYRPSENVLREGKEEDEWQRVDGEGGFVIEISLRSCNKNNPHQHPPALPTSKCPSTSAPSNVTHLQLLASNRRFCSSVCCMIWDKRHTNCTASTARAGGNKIFLSNRVRSEVCHPSVSLRINNCCSPYYLLCRRRIQETRCKSTSAGLVLEGLGVEDIHANSKLVIKPAAASCQP